ncbi:polyisoprenoid-binding protein YceI [Actinocorallia herbida]|uniref:Polyisoprenoid-binding protein YceI n=1 Tax=Actinocorallia herbida TaxID=58109 RepID=A0A3N1CSX4_9ACTN|nr:YceI family protein [Actinocorallia herbida]ROO84417.1 polyisoprenoid-binding protein YceI [Actinocorallia herbida]
MKKWTWWVVGVVGVLFLGFVVAPFVYTRFIEGDAPEKLSVGSASPSAAAAGAAGEAGAAASADGAWKVGTGSQAGYRVKEVLFGQSVEAVGRTDDVTGDLTITGSTVNEGSFTVQMAGVKSDQERRDAQFQGRIMSVGQFPTSTFKLTSPIELGTLPAVGAQANAEAKGELTLKGKTQPVTFPVTASRTAADTFEVAGQIPVTFADYGIANPSFGGISVEDDGQVEFLLKFTR